MGKPLVNTDHGAHDQTVSRQNFRGQHRWKPGECGNPKGLRRGSWSLSQEIREQLKRIPPGEEKPSLAIIAERIINIAAYDPSSAVALQAADLIFKRLEGAPKQHIHIYDEREDALLAIQSIITLYKISELEAIEYLTPMADSLPGLAAVSAEIRAALPAPVIEIQPEPAPTTKDQTKE